MFDTRNKRLISYGGINRAGKTLNTWTEISVHDGRATLTKLNVKRVDKDQYHHSPPLVNHQMAVCRNAELGRMVVVVGGQSQQVDELWDPGTGNGTSKLWTIRLPLQNKSTDDEEISISHSKEPAHRPGRTLFSLAGNIDDQERFLILFGGSETGAWGPPTSSVLLYDAVKNTWTPINTTMQGSIQSSQSSCTGFVDYAGNPNHPAIEGLDKTTTQWCCSGCNCRDYSDKDESCEFASGIETEPPSDQKPIEEKKDSATSVQSEEQYTDPKPIEEGLTPSDGEPYAFSETPPDGGRRRHLRLMNWNFVVKRKSYTPDVQTTRWGRHQHQRHLDGSLETNLARMGHTATVLQSMSVMSEEHGGGNWISNGISEFAISGSTTWQQAHDKCDMERMQLCSREKICPDGKLNTPFGGMDGKDTWVPTSEASNTWVSVGNFDPSERLCRTHEDSLGAKPEWGTRNASNPIRSKVFCCPPPKERFMLIFGGKNGDGTYLNDVVVLTWSGDLKDPEITWKFFSVPVQGRAPTPRWRHTAAQLFDSQLVIFGGENDAGLVNDRIAVLSGAYKNGNLQWWYPRAANIPARSRHAAIRAAVAGGSSLSLIILGGVSETEDAVVEILNLSAWNSSLILQCNTSRGEYFEADEYECKACTMGQFLNGTNCSACLAGQYANRSGSLSCHFCQPGKHSAGTLGTGSPKSCSSKQNHINHSWCNENCNHNPPHCPADVCTCITNKEPNRGAIDCVDCDEGSHAPTYGSASCEICSQGRYISIVGSSALTCISCPAGYYQDKTSANSCNPCASGKAADFSGASFPCWNCPSGFVSEKTGQRLCDKCREGSAAQNGTHCRECPSGWYHEIGETLIWQFMSGVDLNVAEAGHNGTSNGNTTRTVALPNDTPAENNSAGQIRACEDACVQDEKCLYWTHQLATRSRNSSCILGYEMVPCPRTVKHATSGAKTTTLVRGCINADTTVTSGYGEGHREGYGDQVKRPGACARCEAGFAQPSPGQTFCSLCPRGFFSRESFTEPKCLECASGRYVSSYGYTGPILNWTNAAQSPDDKTSVCPEPMRCGKGQHVNANTSSLADNSSSSYCLECTPGMFQKYDNALVTHCHACSLGRFAALHAASECIFCPLGFASDDARVACVLSDCPDGQVRDENADGINCRAVCPPGSFMFPVEKDDGATQEGYGDIYAQEGGYEYGTSASLVCKQCGPGFFSDKNESAECEACVPGFYAGLPNKTRCSRCGLGLYASDNASRACGVCSVGRFSSQSAATLCEACDRGQFANITGLASCEACARGHYAMNVGSTSCKECARGSYANNTGSEACEHCEGNTFQAHFAATLCEVCEEGTVQASNRTLCVQSGLVVPRVLETVLHFTRSMLEITFDNDIDRGKAAGFPLPGVEFACVRVFDNESASLLGEKNTCRARFDQDTMRTLFVRFGSEATVLVGDTLIMKNGTVKPSSDIRAGRGIVLLPIERQILTVRLLAEPNAQELHPSVVIDSPNRIGICDDLEIDTGLSRGSGGRSFLYSWDINVLNSGSSAFDRTTVARLVNLSSTLANETGASLQIPASNVPRGITLIVSVELTNYIGLSASSTVHVVTESFAIPKASILGESNIVTDRSQTVTLQGFGSATNCESEEKDDAVRFTWMHSLPASGVRSGSNPRNIFVLPNQLEVGQTYTFTLVVSSLVDVRLANQVNATVTVKPQPLLARIGNGETERSVSAEEALVLKGTKSLDPDTETYESLTFYWSSQTLASVVKEQAQANTISLPPGSMRPGDVHTFTLRVSSTNKFGDRESTAKTTVKVRTGATPTVIIASPDDKINFGSRVILAGSINPGGTGGGAPRIDSAWTLVEGVFTDGSTSLKRALLTPDWFPSTVIRPSALLPGAHYTFRLSATSIFGTGYADIKLVTNRAPIPGKVVSRPDDGVIFQTKFVLKAVNWVDEDIPLKFRFLADINFEPLSRFSQGNKFVTDLPLADNGGEDLLIRVQVQDRFGAQSHADTVVKVRKPSVFNNSKALTNIVANATRDLEEFTKSGGDPGIVLATMKGIASLLNVPTEVATGGSESEQSSKEDEIGGVDSVGNRTAETRPQDAGAPAVKEEFNTERSTTRDNLFVVLQAVSEVLEPTSDNLALQASVARRLTSKLSEQSSSTRLRASKFVVALAETQLNNITGKSVNTDTANMLLSTLEAVLQGARNTQTLLDANSRRRRLLEERAASENDVVFENVHTATEKTRQLGFSTGPSWRRPRCSRPSRREGGDVYVDNPKYWHWNSCR